MQDEIFKNGTFVEIAHSVSVKGDKFDRLFVKDSAAKHFSSHTGGIVQYVVSTLDGRTTLYEVTAPGHSAHGQVASMTAAGPFPNPDPFEQYRDTCFRLYPAYRTIEVFHCGPRREQEYVAFPTEMKIRL